MKRERKKNSNNDETDNKKRRKDDSADIEETISLIKEMRSKRDAAVDSMGVHCAPAKKASERDRRYQLLVSLLLSSQTKDTTNHEVVQSIHANVENFDVETFSKLPVEEINSLIRKVGFHNRKAQYLKNMSQILLEKYDGDTPRELSDLLALPGIGPKMAHLFIYHAYNVVSGIGVDTHVHRISNRLGWVSSKTPEATRKSLQVVLEKEHWGPINLLMVGLGQTICTPLSPKCEKCLLRGKCPSSTYRG